MTSNHCFHVRKNDDPATKVIVLIFSDLNVNPDTDRFQHFYSHYVFGTPYHILFLKDPHQLHYTGGIVRDTLMTIADTVSLLRSILVTHFNWTTEALVTIGSSAGGYAALLFGIHLQATCIWAICPQVQTIFRPPFSLHHTNSLDTMDLTKLVPFFRSGVIYACCGRGATDQAECTLLQSLNSAHVTFISIKYKDMFALVDPDYNDYHHNDAIQAAFKKYCLVWEKKQFIVTQFTKL